MQRRLSEDGVACREVAAAMIADEKAQGFVKVWRGGGHRCGPRRRHRKPRHDDVAVNGAQLLVEPRPIQRHELERHPELVAEDVRHLDVETDKLFVAIEVCVGKTVGKIPDSKNALVEDLRKPGSGGIVFGAELGLFPKRHGVHPLVSKCIPVMTWSRSYSWSRTVVK